MSIWSGYDEADIEIHVDELAKERAAYEADAQAELDARDAERKALADEDDSRLARLERLEIERHRVWSDEDELAARDCGAC